MQHCNAVTSHDCAVQQSNVLWCISNFYFLTTLNLAHLVGSFHPYFLLDVFSPSENMWGRCQCVSESPTPEGARQLRMELYTARRWYRPPSLLRELLWIRMRMWHASRTPLPNQDSSWSKILGSLTGILCPVVLAWIATGDGSRLCSPLLTPRGCYMCSMWSMNGPLYTRVKRSKLELSAIRGQCRSTWGLNLTTLRSQVRIST